MANCSNNNLWYTPRPGDDWHDLSKDKPAQWLIVVSIHNCSDKNVLELKTLPELNVTILRCLLSLSWSLYPIVVSSETIKTPDNYILAYCTFYKITQLLYYPTVCKITPIYIYNENRETPRRTMYVSIIYRKCYNIRMCNK